MIAAHIQWIDIFWLVLKGGRTESTGNFFKKVHVLLWILYNCEQKWTEENLCHTNIRIELELEIIGPWHNNRLIRPSNSVINRWFIRKGDLRRVEWAERQEGGRERSAWAPSGSAALLPGPPLHSNPQSQSWGLYLRWHLFR